MPEKLSAYKGRVLVYALNAEDAWQKVDRLMEMAKKEGIDIHIDNVEALV